MPPSWRRPDWSAWASIPPHARTLGVDEMVPAPGQGCLAVQCRADDRVVRAALTTLDHRPSALALAAERALTRALGGGCALPLGAIAAVKGDAIRLAACVASPDGARFGSAPRPRPRTPTPPRGSWPASSRCTAPVPILQELRGE